MCKIGQDEHLPVHILVVEDSAVQAKALRRILAKESYTVSVAKNGVEGLSITREKRPDLVISDIMMPEMNGFELCGHIKTEEKLKTIPVMLLTSLNDPKDVIKGLKCGADNFITKPFDEKYLLSCIKDMLLTRELRMSDRTQMGVEIYFAGEKYLITSERQQILDILLSTYETAVQKNFELVKIHDDLMRLNEQLEEKAKERTAALTAEITERKRTEIALKQSEERFRLAAESSTNLIYEWDIQERVDWFGKIDELLGYAQGEFPGTLEAWANSVHPNDRDRVRAAVKNHLEKNEPYDIEYRIRKKDGSYNYWWARGTAVRDKKGNPYRWVGAVTDVTERKRAEEALRASEERYRILFEGAGEGILVADIESQQFKYANPVFCRMLGYTAEELTQLGVSDIHPKEALDHVVAEFEAQARGEKILSLEIPCLRKDGSVIYTSIATTPVVIDGRKCNVGFFTDITERKKTEEALKQTEEQLHQSRKMEGIGRLAGGIAHDFNNLLTIIKGYSQISIVGLKEGDPLRGNIGEIEKAADRAGDLTRQLLAFSRRQIMDVKILDLNNILKDLEKMLRRIIGEDIELATFLADDLGRIKTDPGQIEQVVMNLAVNAKDAMPQGGKITIETTNVELDEHYARNHIAVTPGRYVMLSLSDTGVGMTSEVKERVFEPFFTTKEKGKGTGLGLSTVYGIVKQSGGNIWIYSELGKGTTIKIYLPLVDEPPEELKKEVVGGELPHGTETILVVEDEEEVRKLAVKILQGQGYEILEAPQGVDALLICEEHEGPIHLLVTDVVMPKMSGRELAERLASIRPEIKVLYISGYTNNAITHHGILDRGMSYMQKPFSLDGLARKVREVLDKA